MGERLTTSVREPQLARLTHLGVPPSLRSHGTEVTAAEIAPGLQGLGVGAQPYRTVTPPSRKTAGLAEREGGPTTAPAVVGPRFHCLVSRHAKHVIALAGP